MAPTGTALDADWLAACRRAVAGLTEVLAAAPSTAERARETGTRGSGGDRTLVLDRVGRDGRAGASWRPCTTRATSSTLCRRSAARSTSAARRVRVIIDPIDGSLNAKRRRLPLRAVGGGRRRRDDGRRRRSASSTTSAPREEWWARRGQGAWLDGERLDPALPERRTRDGRLELLGHRVRRPPLGPGVDRRAGRQRPPPARTRDDRRHPVPGRRRALRRHGHAAALPGRRRRRRAADRPRGRWPRRLLRLRGPAWRAARRRPRAPIWWRRARPRRCASWSGSPRDRLDPGREDRRLRGRHRRRGAARAPTCRRWPPSPSAG